MAGTAIIRVQWRDLPLLRDGLTGAPIPRAGPRPNGHLCRRAWRNLIAASGKAPNGGWRLSARIWNMQAPTILAMTSARLLPIGGSRYDRARADNRIEAAGRLFEGGA